MKTILDAILTVFSLALFSLALFSFGLAGVAAAQENPAPLRSAEPVLPDPVPGRGANYPPSAVTADTAYAGPPREIPNKECDPANPCAFDSSAPGKSELKGKSGPPPGPKE